MCASEMACPVATGWFTKSTCALLTSPVDAIPTRPRVDLTAATPSADANLSAKESSEQADTLFRRVGSARGGDVAGDELVAFACPPCPS
jgi:hypothetical protein